MYSDIFCKVYNEFGWNYYPEVFGEQLLLWMKEHAFCPKTAMDLACGTGILCRILQDHGIFAKGMDFSGGMIDIARENNPDIPFDVADMILYRPKEHYDLVTCTGDAINHIPSITDVKRIFENVYTYTENGGYFLFDILNRNEISDSEPFESDFTDTTRVWFQMTTPTENTVNLKIRVFENGILSLEENIRETVHEPETICKLLAEVGFVVEKCADTLPDNSENHGTTIFVIARKP